jgi:hypothetical protein
VERSDAQGEHGLDRFAEGSGATRDRALQGVDQVAESLIAGVLSVLGGRGIVRKVVGARVGDGWVSGVPIDA